MAEKYENILNEKDRTIKKLETRAKLYLEKLNDKNEKADEPLEPQKCFNFCVHNDYDILLDKNDIKIIEKLSEEEKKFYIEMEKEINYKEKEIVKKIIPKEIPLNDNLMCENVDELEVSRAYSGKVILPEFNNLQITNENIELEKKQREDFESQEITGFDIIQEEIPPDYNETNIPIKTTKMHILASESWNNSNEPIKCAIFKINPEEKPLFKEKEDLFYKNEGRKFQQPMGKTYDGFDIKKKEWIFEPQCTEEVTCKGQPKPLNIGTKENDFILEKLEPKDWNIFNEKENKENMLIPKIIKTFEKDKGAQPVTIDPIKTDWNKTNNSKKEFEYNIPKKEPIIEKDNKKELTLERTKKDWNKNNLPIRKGRIIYNPPKGFRDLVTSKGAESFEIFPDDDIIINDDYNEVEEPQKKRQINATINQIISDEDYQVGDIDILNSIRPSDTSKYDKYFKNPKNSIYYDPFRNQSNLKSKSNLIPIEEDSKNNENEDENNLKKVPLDSVGMEKSFKNSDKINPNGNDINKNDSFLKKYPYDSIENKIIF